MVIYLLDNFLIKNGTDFKIENFFPGQQQTIITGFTQGKPNKEILNFRKETPILFINLSRIHPLYLEHHRKQYGTKGLDKNSLIYYLKSSKAFLAYAHPVRFDTTATSAYLFDHSLLQSMGINFERSFADANTESALTQPDNEIPF